MLQKSDNSLLLFLITTEKLQMICHFSFFNVKWNSKNNFFTLEKELKVRVIPGMTYMEDQANLRILKIY